MCCVCLLVFGGMLCLGSVLFVSLAREFRVRVSDGEGPLLSAKTALSVDGMKR